MGAGLSQTQDGGASSTLSQQSQPATMAEVVRERKKKMNGGLATLRKRLLAGGRRGGRGDRAVRSGDRAAPLRDLLKEWSPLEVGALLEEYEALAALRDLCVQAELARPPAAALRGDLASLYDQRICPDAELLFKGTCFPVHRAILSARCPYFRDLLNSYPSLGARVCLDAPLPAQVDISTVDGLLRYLYAGEAVTPPCITCEGDYCDIRHGSHDVPDCCPTRTESGHGQQHAGGLNRLTLDIVGGGNNVCRRRTDPVLLRRLASDLGATPSALHRDMRHLLDTAEFADASLVFTSEPSQPFVVAGSQLSNDSTALTGPSSSNPVRQAAVARAGSPPSSEYGFRPRLELPCHRAILSARSPFFRSVIQRRCRLQGNTNEALSSVKIVLDERVIPHKYARVLLHAVYTDQVDLNLIMRGGSSIFGCSLLGSHGSSLGEAQAISNNQQNGNGLSPHSPSPLEEAMELYEIGRFLELDILSQGCEDIIAERLSANSLATVLKWSAQPHGSKWVHRQALRFLREEFLTVAAGPALPQLEASHIAHALRCPFLQASELDALRAVLRWGEHRLIKRMEDREPNLLSHTAHSVTRKGVKKRDLSDAELRELLADILPLVRIDHILPPNNEVLNQAIRRGLVSSPPSYMLGDEGSGGSRSDAWIRGKGGLYVRPRLYMPYYEEVKALLEDQMVQEAELLRMRRARYTPDIPDTLYMVSAEPRARSSASGAPAESPRGGSGPGDGECTSRSSDINGINNNPNDATGAAVPPAPATMHAMLARERELRRAPASIRATSLPLSHTAEINRQIRLRVVREFNLPDSVADTLEGAALAFEGTCNGGRRSSPGADMGSGHIRDHCGADSNSHHMSGDGSRSGFDEDGDIQLEEANGRCLKISRDNDNWNSNSPRTSRCHLPALLTEGEVNRPNSVDLRQSKCRSSQSGRGLSEAMPDVAMATSSLGRLRISTYNQLPNTMRSSHNFNQTEESEFDSANNCFYPLNKDQKGTCDSNHSLSREGSLAHTPVSFMNPNQHLLQEGCGFGVFGYKGNRDGVRKGQRQLTPTQQQCSSQNNTIQEPANFQRNENESAPSLQLDLGDGNQHSSPGRQSTSRSQSPWNQLNDCQRHDRLKTLPSNVSASDYSQSQQQCSPSNRASYSRYLSSQSTSTQSTFNPSVAKVQHQQYQIRDECERENPNSSNALAPSSPFRISANTLSQTVSNNNNNTFVHNNGFSTLQHHSRSRSPKRVHGNATLQRPRPLCSSNNQCVASTNVCSGTSSNCSSTLIPCPSLSTPISSEIERDMHRSQSAGSVASLGADLDKRENKMGIQNASGYGHLSSFGVVHTSDSSEQALPSHAPSTNHGQPIHHRESSPRHFRSISALPEQVVIYSDNTTNSRNNSYQMGASLIEMSAHRNQLETLQNWMQSGNQYVQSDDRNQHFLRNSRENFYSGGSQGFSVQRDGSFRTVPSSPFSSDNPYSGRMESPFNCLQANGRPGSCGLADVINVNSYNSGSRGDSPLYNTMGSGSRGNSPFRTLDSTPNQFSRGNSPYSSNHRMDFVSRMQNESNYCSTNVQRSSSPNNRTSYQSRNVSGSPSNLKIQQQSTSRTVSNSPSSNMSQPSSSKSRTLSNSPTSNYSLLKQGSRTLTNSPSVNFSQGQSLKSRTLSNSPSSSSPMNFNQGSLKCQQRTSPGQSSSANSGKMEVYPGTVFCQQQGSREGLKSQTFRLSSSQYHSSGPPRFL